MSSEGWIGEFITLPTELHWYHLSLNGALPPIASLQVTRVGVQLPLWSWCSWDTNSHQLVASEGKYKLSSLLGVLIPGARSGGLTTALLPEVGSSSSPLEPAVIREKSWGRKLPTGPFADQLVSSHSFCAGVETQPPGLCWPLQGGEEQEQSVNKLGWSLSFPLALRMLVKGSWEETEYPPALLPLASVRLLDSGCVWTFHSPLVSEDTWVEEAGECWPALTCTDSLILVGVQTGFSPGSEVETLLVSVGWWLSTQVHQHIFAGNQSDVCFCGVNSSKSAPYPAPVMPLAQGIRAPPTCLGRLWECGEGERKHPCLAQWNHDGGIDGWFSTGVC